jgi:hypothetical protein
VSAALLDSRLSEGAALCERLAEHGIPASSTAATGSCTRPAGKA